MKVVIAVHHFPPRYTSGAELRAYRTASWLRDCGHDVHVVCIEHIDRGGRDGLTFADDTYDGLPVRRLSFNLLKAPDPFRWSYDNPWVGECMRAYLAELQPDILHLISGYLMSGSTVCAAVEVRSSLERRIATVVTLTDFWFLCPRITLLRSNGEVCAPPFDPVTCARCLGEEKRRYRAPGRLMPGLMQLYWQLRTDRSVQVKDRMASLGRVMERVDAMISPSRFLRDMFIRAGVAPDRIAFSRQGRDFPELVPDLLQKSPASRLRVGYMGQIEQHKGVHTLLQAVRKLPDVDLEVKVYGDPDQAPAYTRELCRIMGGDPRIGLKGTYSREEVSHVFHDLDVVVVPSIWYENSPNTILEAFAHRTPVVASALGGMAEMVQDGVNGLRFVPGDPASLAARLRQLVQDPGLLPRLRAGIGPVKSVAEEMAELLAIYDSLQEVSKGFLGGSGGKDEGVGAR